jgi:hypothetical protein
MANIETVKQTLKKGIRFGTAGQITSKQVDEVADRLLNDCTTTKEALEQIGKELIGDPALENFRLNCGFDKFTETIQD